MSMAASTILNRSHTRHTNTLKCDNHSEHEAIPIPMNMIARLSQSVSQ